MFKKWLGRPASVLVVLAVPAMALWTLSPWNHDATSASEEITADFAVGVAASEDQILDLSGWEYTGHSQHANGKGKGHQGQGKGQSKRKSPFGVPPGPPPHAGQPGPPPHANNP